MNKIDHRDSKSDLTFRQFIFKSPPHMVFVSLFFLIYLIIALAFFPSHSFEILPIVQAAPFIISGIIVGIFSMIFWALNYIGRQHKVDLKIYETERLLEVRRNAVESVLSKAGADGDKSIDIIKAQLIFGPQDDSASADRNFIRTLPEYSEIVKAITKRDK